MNNCTKSAQKWKSLLVMYLNSTLVNFWIIVKQIGGGYTNTYFFPHRLHFRFLTEISPSSRNSNTHICKQLWWTHFIVPRHWHGVIHRPFWSSSVLWQIQQIFSSSGSFSICIGWISTAILWIFSKLQSDES